MSPCNFFIITISLLNDLNDDITNAYYLCTQLHYETRAAFPLYLKLRKTLIALLKTGNGNAYVSEKKAKLKYG